MKTIAAIPAIVLAGGQGTRLRSVVADLPKPMAPINGLPFLQYIFRNLQKNGIREVVLAVGYKYEIIYEYFGNIFENITIQYSIENEPLGTGGAIAKAFEMADDEAFLINGDTFFDIPLADFYQLHTIANSSLSLALKPMKDFDRYGIVHTNQENQITFFEEKKKCKNGLINAGIYLAKKEIFNTVFRENVPSKFSFETAVLENEKIRNQLFGFPYDNYFIDIGIPDDYYRAQTDFKQLF